MKRSDSCPPVAAQVLKDILSLCPEQGEAIIKHMSLFFEQLVGSEVAELEADRIQTGQMMAAQNRPFEDIQNYHNAAAAHIAAMHHLGNTASFHIKDFAATNIQPTLRLELVEDLVEPAA